MDGDYETVSGTFETESTVKGSRFIAVVQRCPDADSIKEALEGISARYPNATHYCYAAVYGGRGRGERFSDNGEPSGTAGRPILSVLRGSGLSDTICVVVRYFGGTKLGLGRLTRTYRDVALKAVEETVMADLVPGYEASLSMSYSDFAIFEKECSRLSVAISNESFLEKVSLKVSGDAKIVKPLVEKYTGRLEIIDQKESLAKRRRHI